MDINPATGWLKGVTSIESPNRDERPQGAEIDLLVIHAISLPPKEYGGGHVAALFTNTLDPSCHPCFEEIADLKVSAHAFICRDGGLVQFVPFLQRAWHAGISCFGGREQCNDFSIGVELEGHDDEPFESVQYLRLAELTRVLMDAYPGITRDCIVGHSEIAPGRKTDPGPYFDWQYFRSLLTVVSNEGGL